MRHARVLDYLLEHRLCRRGRKVAREVRWVATGRGTGPCAGTIAVQLLLACRWGATDVAEANHEHTSFAPFAR